MAAFKDASPWVGSHYCEEFAESHGKAMVVRQRYHEALLAQGPGAQAGVRDRRTQDADIDLTVAQGCQLLLDGHLEEFEVHPWERQSEPAQDEGRDAVGGGVDESHR